MKKEDGWGGGAERKEKKDAKKGRKGNEKCRRASIESGVTRSVVTFYDTHQFAGVQAINTAILDLRPDLRKHEIYVVLGICVTCWLLAMPMVFDGGIYLFTLMDWNTASWAILLIDRRRRGRRGRLVLRLQQIPA